MNIKSFTYSKKLALPQEGNASHDELAKKSQEFESRVSGLLDMPASLAAPTIWMVTTTSFSALNNMVDADGVSNVQYHLFAADGMTPTGNVTGQLTGQFSGLTAGTTYVVKSSATTAGVTWETSVLHSSGTSVTTMSEAPSVHAIHGDDFSALHGVMSTVQSLRITGEPDSIITVSVESDDQSCMVNILGSKFVIGSGEVAYTILPLASWLPTLTFAATDTHGNVSTTSVSVTVN